MCGTKFILNVSQWPYIEPKYQQDPFSISCKQKSRRKKLQNGKKGFLFYEASFRESQFQSDLDIKHSLIKLCQLWIKDV